MNEAIKQFFTSKAYAVIGVSTNREKFGNMVFKCLNSRFSRVYPIHQVQTKIEGIKCFKNIYDLPDDVESLSIITPPAITEQIVEEAYSKGIKNIWMQPGAESKMAIEKCHLYGINLIAQGPCILVQLGWFKKNS